jgi:glycosyltransferase involved in cell wall biosynthesis
MRLLHVGSGFKAWRRGGLVVYAQDLIDAQRAAGDDVAYFFSGRHYPFAREPRVRRWTQRGVPMLEVIDSPLHDHGRQPVLELDEPRVERLFSEALEEWRPDVVHVHELAGLPSSLLDLTREAGVPTVVTLQDYFPVCSTFKLLDAAGQVCTRLEIGADCAATVAADTRPRGLLIDSTLHHDLPTRGLGLLNRAPLTRAVSAAEAARRSRGTAPPTPEAFQRRRERNVQRLNGADCVIAMSTRVAEIYARLGVERERLRTVHLTLGHIAGLTPRPARQEGPITFGTLAGFESEAKGARLLIDAMRALAERGLGERVRLLVYGHVDPVIERAAAGVPGIEIGAPFEASQLDRILDGIDVGLIPSVWEEAYGYVGVEFLAKAIPVIANDIGGMPDYVVPGETGWLNRSCTAAELADIMAGIAEAPETVSALHDRLVAERPAAVKPMAAHVEEMRAIYADVQGRR